MRSVVAMALIWGCSDAPETPIEAPADPWIEVGSRSATNQFRPVADDDTFTLVAGPAGGWLFEVAGRVHHLPEIVGVWTTSIRRISTGEEIGGTDKLSDYKTLRSYREKAGSGEFFGHYAYTYSVQDILCDLEGEQVEICITVVDPDSEAFADECVVVTVALEPDFHGGCVN